MRVDRGRGRGREVAERPGRGRGQGRRVRRRRELAGRCVEPACWLRWRGMGCGIRSRILEL